MESEAEQPLTVEEDEEELEELEDVLALHSFTSASTGEDLNGTVEKDSHGSTKSRCPRGTSD